MKVFGVGYQRTGTTSLAQALNHIGIKTLQFPKDLYYDIDHQVGSEYDGFTDDPVPLLYPQLDEKFPGSKFIHTIRDDESWLKSIEWLFSVGRVKFKESFDEHGDEFNRQLFGTTQFESKLFLEKYREYNREVAEYFSKRPDDYLLMDVTKGEGYEKLCPFLGMPVPEETSFPHRNKQESIVKVRMRRLLKKLRLR